MGWFKLLHFFGCGDSIELEIVKSERDVYKQMHRDSNKYLQQQCAENVKLIEQLKEQQKMSSSARTNLSTKYARNKFRVLERMSDSDGDYHIVSHDNYENALEAAKRLAAQYPGNKYFIMTYVAEIKADVPVVATELTFKSTEKSDVKKDSD